MSNKNKKAIVFSSLSAMVGASALVPAATLAAEDVFPDVPANHAYYDVIQKLANEGVVSGFQDGEFKMGASITRAQAAQMVAKLTDLDLDLDNAPTAPFSDIKTDAWYTKAVNALTEAGVISGYTDGTFKPNNEITRAEFAQLVVKAFKVLPSKEENAFEDVVEGAWYEDAVKALFGSDLIKGQSETTYGPNSPMKRGDASFLLAKTAEKLEDVAFQLSVLYQNDTHAHLDNMPKTVTAVKEARAKRPDSLLLHAGDAFSGTLYFNEFEGQADLAMMNLMGIDAWTLGNHEFDLGSNAEGHQALVDFITGANFPTVSSNVDFSGDDKFTGLFSDTISSDPENGKIYNGIVKEVDGEKVGIFGLTTKETADIASPGEVKFQDYLEESKKAVKAFEDMGVNKIIAITHIGYDDNANVDNDLTLAAAVEGIDIIVGGHTHSQLDEPVVITEDVNGANKEEPTIIVQAGEYNNNLGTLQVNFDENGVIVGHAGELIEIGDQEPDAEAAEILKPYKERVEQVSNDEIGVTLEKSLENPRTAGDNTKPSVRKNETILGNIITDGMLSKAKEYNENVVIAFQNGGGIRSEIDAGPITVGEVITVLPFGNTLATMDLTGAEIKAAFEHSLKEYPAESGGFLHLSGGKLVFDSSKPVGERIVSLGYYDDNGELTDFEDNQTYTIATNAFTAKGGDGYDMLAAAYADNRATELGLSDWENFLEQLVKLGSDGIPTEVEGRIVEGEAEENDNFELSIMHTNDMHAHVEAAPQLATAVKEIRAEKPNALLLDAGDVFQGTLYFTEYQGQADLALMNYLEYDVMTLGNHEFDLGNTEDGHKALREFVEKATFPIVTANVDFSQDLVLADLHKDEISSEAVAGNIYDGLIMEVDGEEIGIFGLTTETTAGSSSPKAVTFTNYIEEAKEAVANLEERGVDKIIALTHLGYNSPVDNNDILLAENVAGIDVIVGGHSHTTLSEPVEITADANGDAKDLTLIVQTGSNGANLGTLDVEFDENGVIVGHAGELISLSGLEADEGAAEILARFTAGIEEVQKQQTGGVALNDLPNPRTGDVGNTSGLSVRNSETALGNLITDGMLSEGKKVEPKATIALQNGGGIRTNVNAGPITMGKVLEVLSFNNGLYSAELTGTELMRVLESGVSGVAAPDAEPAEGGSFLHNAGLKVTFDSTKEPGSRIESVEVADENGNYARLDENKSYTLVTNIYIALGNGYDNVFAEANADGRVHDIGLSDWESFANYLGEAGEVDPKIEGRVLDLARQ